MLHKSGKIILTVGDELSSISVIVSNEIIHHQYLTSHTEDVNIVNNLLKKNKHYPIVILIDSFEQTFNEEIIVGLNKFDLWRIIKRKINKESDENNFIAFLPTGKTQRSDFENKFIKVQLKRTELINFWLNIIAHHNNQFEGIYSTAAEMQVLYHNFLKPNFTPIQFEKVKDKYDNWQIIISLHKTSGYRIVVLKNGKLNYTENYDLNQKNENEVIVREIEAKINAINLNLKFNPNDRLDLFIIVPARLKNNFQDIRASVNNLIVTTSYELAKKLNIKNYSDEKLDYADFILSVFFASADKIVKLHSPSTSTLIKNEKFIMLWKRGFILIPIISLLLGIFLSNNNELETKILQTNKILADNKLMLEQGKKKYKEMKKNEIIGKFVPLYRQLTGDNISPLDLLLRLENIESPDISIKSLKWVNLSKENNKTVLELNLYYYPQTTSEDKLFEKFDNFIEKVKLNFTNYNVRYVRSADSHYNVGDKVIEIMLLISGPIG